MEDTYSYRGWLISDSFLKRAFAVWGYTLVAQVVIMLIFGLVFIIPAAIAAFVFAMGT